MYFHILGVMECMWSVCVYFSEQREGDRQEEGSEDREEGQDSPIPSGDDIHLYGNQTHQGGTGQCVCVCV